MSVYGYCRCSTNETKQDVARQKKELKEMGASIETIFFEYESGTKVNRPELIKLLEIVQKGDTIATTEVNRITRSTKQLCDNLDKYKSGLFTKTDFAKICNISIPTLNKYLTIITDK